MKNGRKIAIAAGVASMLAAVGVAGNAYADRNGNDRGHGGWQQRMTEGHGMSGFHRMGRRHGMRGRHGKMMMRMMERFDTNGDGKVTREEIDAVRKEMTAKYDADKDGQLTLGEFEGVWLEMTRPRMVRRFQFLDTDGDAKITAEEIDRPLNKMFSRMDRNGDGAISKDDRKRRWKRGGDESHWKRGGDENRDENSSKDDDDQSGSNKSE